MLPSSLVLTTFASQFGTLCWVLLWMALTLTEARYVYWAAGGSYNYDEAKAACEKDIYSHLATIPDASVTAQIQSVVAGEMWVGARKGPGPSYTLRWVTGAVGAEDGGQGRAFWSRTQGNTGYTNFVPGEPYLAIQQYELCMTASASGWNDNSCNQKRDGGLCETFRCRAGSYNPVQNPAQFRCDSCPAGTYLSSEGATSSSQCTSCSPGYYSGVQSASCSVCPAGTFSPNSGSSACLDCSAGTFAATEGCSSCSSCPPGTYNSMLRQSRCSPCPIGSFNPDTGSLDVSACIPCPKNTYSAVEARTQLSDCLPCPVGMHSEGGSDSCTATPTFSVTSTANRTTSQGVSAASKSLTSASLSPHLTDPTTTLNQTASLYTRTNSTSSTISLMPPRKDRGMIAIAKTLSQPLALPVATAGATAAVASGVFSVVTPGKLVRMGMMLESIDCEYLGEEEETPSFFQYPFQVALEGEGRGTSLHAGSSLLSTAAFVVVPYLLLCLTSWLLTYAWCRGMEASFWTVLRKIHVNVLTILFSVGLTYFGPSVVQSIMIVIPHSSSALTVICCILCGLVIAAAPIFLCWRVVFRFDVDVGVTSKKQQIFNRPSSPCFIEKYGFAFDGARDLLNSAHRCIYVEDLLVSLLMGIVSGVRPSANSDCRGVSVALFIVTAFHFAYLVKFCPFRSKLELLMSFINGIIQLLMGLVCSYITLFSPTNSSAFVAFLGLLAFMQNSVFFVQAAVLAAWAIVRARRNRQQESAGCPTESDGPVLSNPLLI